MKPEYKRCNLEQSKKLRSLGIVIETEKYWVKSLGTINIPFQWVLVDRQLTVDSGINPKDWPDAYIPAPDVAELGELLPFEFEINSIKAWWIFSRGLKMFSITILKSGINNFEVIKPFDRKTELQAKYDSLIWLIENKHI